MIKKIVAVVASVMLLGGCAIGSGSISDPRQADGFAVIERYYKLSDGRTVFCILISSGASCDWENAQ